MVDRARRNLRHAQIRAENISANMPVVGSNSFVELFDKGYDFLVLIDDGVNVAHTQIDHLYPGLRWVRWGLQREYEKVLFHEQGARVAFARVNRHLEEEHKNLPDTNVLKFIHERAKKMRKEKELVGYQMGSVDILSAKDGLVERLPIYDVTDAVNGITTFDDFLDSLHDPFLDEVTYVRFYGGVEQTLKNLGVQYPPRSELDFTKRYTPH